MSEAGEDVQVLVGHKKLLFRNLIWFVCKFMAIKL